VRVGAHWRHAGDPSLARGQVDGQALDEPEPGQRARLTARLQPVECAGVDWPPLGPLVEARIVERQAHVIAVARLVECERSSPLSLGLRHHHEALSIAGSAVSQIRTPRREPRPSRLHLGPHQPRPGRVAVAIPALEDAVGPLHRQVLGHQRIEPSCRVRPPFAVEQNQGALLAVGIRVGSAPVRVRHDVIHSLEHRVAVPGLAQQQIGGVERVVHIAPCIGHALGALRLHREDPVPVPRPLQQRVEHTAQRRLILRRAIGSIGPGRHECLRETTQDLAAVVDQVQHRVDRLAGREVPFVTG